MMLEIRKLLNTRLKAIHPRVYFLRAPETAVFPYLVYSFEITNLEDGLSLLTLDVDGWDNTADTTALETMMENVHSSFKEANIFTEKLFVHFHSDRRLPVVDDDPSLNRRTNIYLGRLFER
ncbi:hypothetical protein M3204_13925 [Mesobacillus subterraneus]|uniref:hypothetical protein n=1 Tax=Mesobacillus subterraneus TaxID=285983 RepID=UPI0020406A5D|nr:hypothetical protein [Mesobacillus subterraneus]MCM3665511.1 hypothetical protein [Mesobacillus subterraneus]MCM3686070.1 hypothetical protein [Mesobacillus subterraneus]